MTFKVNALHITQDLRDHDKAFVSKLSRFSSISDYLQLSDTLWQIFITWFKYVALAARQVYRLLEVLKIPSSFF